MLLLAVLGGCLGGGSADEDRLSDDELARHLATAGPELLDASFEVFQGNRAVQGLGSAGAVLVSAADTATGVDGVTFVRNPPGASYLPDGLRTPVPSSGARFILYDPANGAESGTVDVKLPTGSSAVVQALSSGNAVDYAATTLEAGVNRPPSLVYGVGLYAGDRRISLEGSVDSGTLIADFAYADAANVGYVLDSPDRSTIERTLTTGVRGLGTVQTRLQVSASVRFLDADNAGTVLVRWPAGPLREVSVLAVLSGVRGNWAVRRLEVNGDATFLRPSDCQSGPGTVTPCIRYRDDAIPPETFAALHESLVQAPLAINAAAGGLLVPALFAVRWQQHRP